MIQGEARLRTRIYARGSSEEVSEHLWQALDRVRGGVEGKKKFRLSPFRGIRFSGRFSSRARNVQFGNSVLQPRWRPRILGEEVCSAWFFDVSDFKTENPAPSFP